MRNTWFFSFYSYEQFKLEPGGDLIRVEIDLVLPELGRKKLVKYLSRVPESDVFDPEDFRSAASTSNWAHLGTHTPRVFKTVSIAIPECITIAPQTKRESSGGGVRPPAGPAAAGRAAPGSEDEPRIAKYFAGQTSDGQEVTVFTIEVRIVFNYIYF